LVQDGDLISLDVEARTLTLEVSDKTLQQRREKWVPRFPQAGRGYVKLFQDHVEQAHLGADLDFLKGHSGDAVVRDSH
jgi:dihydroxy-acid dehydratase